MFCISGLTALQSDQQYGRGDERDKETRKPSDTYPVHRGKNVLPLFSSILIGTLDVYNMPRSTGIRLSSGIILNNNKGGMVWDGIMNQLVTKANWLAF